MNEDAIAKYILETFAGVNVITASGNSFFFYDPDNKIPFATIVTNNEYDDGSDLDRPSVFRLNVGVGKNEYRTLFATERPDGTEIVHTEGHDFTALDKLMPHPQYGRMFWVCVLNPSDATFDKIKPLLAAAYEIAVTKYERLAKAGQQPRTTTSDH
jgi:hypothetical protein